MFSVLLHSDMLVNTLISDIKTNTLVTRIYTCCDKRQSSLNIRECLPVQLRFPVDGSETLHKQ